MYRELDIVCTPLVAGRVLNKMSPCLFQDYLQGCLEQIEEMVQAHVGAEVAAGSGHQVTSTSGGPSAPQRPLGDQNTSQEKILEHEKAGTPTDVRDVHF